MVKALQQIHNLRTNLIFKQKLNDLKNDIIAGPIRLQNGVVINSEWLETQINKNLKPKN
jgi:hypothetical protein